MYSRRLFCRTTGNLKFPTLSSIFSCWLSVKLRSLIFYVWIASIVCFSIDYSSITLSAKWLAFVSSGHPVEAEVGDLLQKPEHSARLQLNSLKSLLSGAIEIQRPCSCFVEGNPIANQLMTHLRYVSARNGKQSLLVDDLAG